MSLAEKQIKLPYKPSTAKISVFLEEVTLADDQLMTYIWLAAPGCS